MSRAQNIAKTALTIFRGHMPCTLTLAAAAAAAGNPAPLLCFHAHGREA